jgi:hypothetical protein
MSVQGCKLRNVRCFWGFKLEKARDENGVEITPDTEKLTEGLLVSTLPFPAKITPRSEMHARIIRQEWEKAKVLLDEEMQWREVPKVMAFSTYIPEVGVNE